MKILFFILFIICSLVHLYACFPEPHQLLRKITKLLLMPLLALCYLILAKAPSYLVLIGLFFGFVGDFFLLEPEKKLNIPIGMAAFGLGHICYGICYLQRMGRVTPWVAVVAAAFYALALGAALYKLYPLFPQKMAIPCVGYMTLLVGANCLALLLFLSRGGNACGLTYMGSVLFLCSDLMLCLEFFRQKTRYGNFLVMLSYILAQACIVLGLAF